MNIINEQIRAFLDEPDMIAALGNISACIMMNYENINWSGFYFAKNGELVLGPFQGKPACTHIPFDKGVCGKTYRDKAVQRIDDVLSFPGHIACDSASRSELCVPVIVSGECVAEIDLDAPVPCRFTETEEKEMLQAAEDIASAFLQHNWKF
ncbi:MAG: GAF domain-containing protein [Solobacterium sp.]|nr:GAF domain-containing protein [Solobacterium sp.]